MELNTDRVGARAVLEYMPPGSRCPYLERQDARDNLTAGGRSRDNRLVVARVGAALRRCLAIRECYSPSNDIRLKREQHNLLLLRHGYVWGRRRLEEVDDELLPPSLRRVVEARRLLDERWAAIRDRVDENAERLPELYERDDEWTWTLRADPRIQVEVIRGESGAPRYGRWVPYSKREWYIPDEKGRIFFYTLKYAGRRAEPHSATPHRPLLRTMRWGLWESGPDYDLGRWRR